MILDLDHIKQEKQIFPLLIFDLHIYSDMPFSERIYRHKSNMSVILLTF